MKFSNLSSANSSPVSPGVEGSGNGDPGMAFSGNGYGDDVRGPGAPGVPGDGGPRSNPTLKVIVIE